MNTARFTEAIERHVRAHPEQWFWVHRRWKSRPRVRPPPTDGRARRSGRCSSRSGSPAPPAASGAVGEDPAAEVTEALRSLGPPGLLWGRLAIEEESPVGAWTPLSGTEVTLYPATPALITELERIRQSARTSATQYESAVARVQAALAAHQGRIDRQTAPPPSPGQGLVAEPPLVVGPAGRQAPRSRPSLAPSGRAA